MSEALFDLCCVDPQAADNSWILLKRGSVDREVVRNSRHLKSRIECDQTRDATCDWSGVLRKNGLIAAIKHIWVSALPDKDDPEAKAAFVSK